MTVVRTQFDSRVDKVLVDLGSTVKKETRCSSSSAPTWPRPRAITRWPSASGPTTRRCSITRPRWPRTIHIARKELIEVENDEAQSRLKMKLAKDKLLVYGLTEKEIENARNEDGVQKAKMILRSRADGVVVERTVVQGNYYTSADLLMTIAPLDHLWVRGSVSELDADKVEVGQKLKVIFPVLRSNDRRQGRLHRQGDRFRVAVREVPHHHPQSRGASSRRACSYACCSRFRPSRDGP